ncbi:MAG: ABC transporter substrate-binding protein [Clostridia bacterium]|nr:ABC transporter substrate-binding protein [Clostridia bacterium]
MKRVLSLVLVLILTCAIALSASAEGVEDALKAASAMTNEQLYEKAQAEIAAGAQLNFYSTTSFAEKAAANFMEAYPALAGKVVYAEIDDGETYTKLTNQIGSGVKDSPDMALVQNGPDLKVNLLEDGLSLNYFPAALAEVVPEKYQDPAVVTFINSLMIYNNKEGSVGVANVWQLVEPEWSGKVFFKDPTNETVNLNFLIMLTSPEWTEKMTKAYEAFYGKAWESTEFASASYQWIDGFLKNVNYTFTSASKIATGIASGAAGNMGIFVFSKLRKVDENDRGNLTVLQFENDVDCFSGFMYNVYATVCKDTDCPYACALFINWLLSEEGFAGSKSWNSSQGYYSPNTTILKPEGLEDQPYVYWDGKLVFEDLDYIDGLGESYNDIYRFINVRVSK